VELASGHPAQEKTSNKKKAEAEPEELAVQRNRASMQSMVEKNPAMKDFYNDYDPYAPDKSDAEVYKRYLRSLSDTEKSWHAAEGTFYQLDFSNVGGMVMPLVIRFEFADGTREIKRIPAEIWNQNNLKTSKVFLLEKELVSVTLDPFQETADCDMGNNHWPPRIEESRFELYKRSGRGAVGSNPMQER
jgi:hypothetical protein